MHIHSQGPSAHSDDTWEEVDASEAAHRGGDEPAEPSGRQLLRGLVATLEGLDDDVLDDPSVSAGIRHATKQLSQCKSTRTISAWFYSKVGTTTFC